MAASQLERRLHSHDLSILFQDDHILVVDKPAGMLVIPDRYDASKPNLATLLKNILGSVYVVHRMDKETSGIVVLAKDPRTHRSLNQLFEEHRVKKTYHALVHGALQDETMTIDLPLAQKKPGMMGVDRRDGKSAITVLKVLQRFGRLSLVELTPRTGRTHQLRVHLSAIGTPIACDPVYGNGRPIYLSDFKADYKKRGEEKGLIARTALHALRLSFLHPITVRDITLDSPIPKDLGSAIRMLKKYDQ